MSKLFPFDSDTPGVRFYNLTSSIRNNHHIQMDGLYQASDLIPVLLFSVGVPWMEPCLKHVCCLWDMAERYKDHDLMTALGPTCNEDVNLTGVDLLKGNSPAATSWTVDTMIHPSFVAMLFLCLTPTFYMFYEIRPMQWIDTASVHWHSSWYGQPCHQVLYPDGQQVCIACFNSKPDNAVFVFTANWFTTFECKWICKPGYTGPNCEITVDLAIYATGCVVAALCVAGVVLCALDGKRRRGSAPSPPVFVPPATSEPIVRPPVVIKTSDMIVFKDNALNSEIRIKLL